RGRRAVSRDGRRRGGRARSVRPPRTRGARPPAERRPEGAAARVARRHHQLIRVDRARARPRQIRDIYVNFCVEIVDLADAPGMVKRQRRSARFAAVALAALMLPALAAAAEEVTLRPRYQVGDRYALALTTETKTRVDARGASRNAFRESVELRYRAQ